ncbi:CoA transferase [Streptomyces sp. NPDC048479]|uniref:CaiB/BaiF CoA transferase family protein n=1 Tax=Streptomyces sp. NPDC048479 TaxID=3154725 RepID=UPI003442CB83
MTSHLSLASAPLAGVRVLDYAQYVAGPFATMLLADLGADVVKVEPPRGDAWRHYQPLTADGGTWFYALNRNKRSVVADLKTAEGRALSSRLIASADVVVHNMPPKRALAFGLDRRSVGEINPRAVWTCVSAFGSDGPMADALGYDLIAQAASGLLLADARPGDPVPRRSGGIAIADITAGLLTAIAALAGLADSARHPASGTHATARGLEVSLLGASLAVQVQRLVEVEHSANKSPAPPDTAAGGHGVSSQELADLAARQERSDEMEPYYRCYRAADGFLALACLNMRQRVQVQQVLDVPDPWADNPQAMPADDTERRQRAALKERFAAVIATRPVHWWLREFGARDVPCGTVHAVEELHRVEQAHANGLIQRVEQPDVGTVSLLGTLFKVDGRAAPNARPAPRLGEHTDELRAELATPADAQDQDHGPS